MDKKRLLIADDAMEIRMLVRAMLAADYEIIEATDGEEAVKAAVEKMPEIVLMDIMMPVLDGIQATLMIKNNPKTKDIPVIMLTALSDSDSVLTSYDYGADHYLVKPFDRAKLLKAIDIVEKPKERNL
ncbi:MAG: response regulator [Candidatus Eremiobacteraeota bacterium]|nr:response regulator [Candidatus Eremiobacteraeota bacterium]